MRIISIKATNIELTAAIRSYAEEKAGSLEKMCEEFDPASTMEIEIGKSTLHHSKGPFYRAEMMLHIPGKDLRAENEAEDLYAAIDNVKDQLRRQLADYKDMLHDSRVRASRPGKE